MHKKRNIKQHTIRTLLGKEFKMVNQWIEICNQVFSVVLVGSSYFREILAEVGFCKIWEGSVLVVILCNSHVRTANLKILSND